MKRMMAGRKYFGASLLSNGMAGKFIFSAGSHLSMMTNDDADAVMMMMRM